MKHLLEYNDYLNEIDAGTGTLAAIGAAGAAAFIGTRRLLAARRLKSLGKKLAKAMIEKVRAVGDIEIKINKLRNKISKARDKFPDINMEITEDVIDRLKEEKERKEEAYDKKINAIEEKMDAIVESRDSSYVRKVASLEKAKAKEAAADTEIKYASKSRADSIYAERQRLKIKIKRQEEDIKREERRMEQDYEKDNP